jgi:hypothetical protein
MQLEDGHPFHKTHNEPGDSFQLNDLPIRKDDTLKEGIRF